MFIKWTTNFTIFFCFWTIHMSQLEYYVEAVHAPADGIIVCYFDSLAKWAAMKHRFSANLNDLVVVINIFGTLYNTRWGQNPNRNKFVEVPCQNLNYTNVRTAWPAWELFWFVFSSFVSTQGLRFKFTPPVWIYKMLCLFTCGFPR